MARPRPTVNWDDVPVVMDVAYAARLTGYSTIRIYQLIAAGEFPASQRKKGCAIHIEKDDLREFLASTQVSKRLKIS